MLSSVGMCMALRASAPRYMNWLGLVCRCPDSRRVVAQVRSAVPMYLLSRKIKAEGFKVVLSGEGADEVYGGYLFFHKAPSPRHFHECGPSPLVGQKTGCRVS